MKNRLLVLLSGWLMLAQSANAQLIAPGDIFELSFFDLPYAGSPGYLDEMRVRFNISPRFSFFGAGGAIPNGLFNVDLFENTDSATPFFSDRDSDAGSTLGYIFDAVWFGHLPWFDREGKLVVWATDGDFELTSIEISVYSEGVEYQQSYALTAVPLPTSAWLLASGLLAMLHGTRFPKSK